MYSASDTGRPPSSWDILRKALHGGFQSVDRLLQEYGPMESNHISLQEANQGLAHQGTAREVPRMKFRVEVQLPELR
jgi:hypothetical protein